MLKMNKIELELISDIGMYSFVKRRMRRGISHIGRRYSKANNKYVESYDDKKSNKYIAYLDANSSYGWSVSQYLPYSEFKWLN